MCLSFLKKNPFQFFGSQIPQDCNPVRQNKLQIQHDKSPASRKFLFRPKYSASCPACGHKYHRWDYIMQITSRLYKMGLYRHAAKRVAPENINAIPVVLLDRQPGGSCRSLQSTAKPIQWELPESRCLLAQWVTCCFSPCSIHTWSPTSICGDT